MATCGKLRSNCQPVAGREMACLTMARWKSGAKPKSLGLQPFYRVGEFTVSKTEAIESAFFWRSCPPKLISVKKVVTTEQQDAQWFTGLDWRTITRSDWEQHRDAIYAFTPEAFAYFLPSILALTSATPGEWLYVADVLLSILDRSPMIEYWDDFLLTRLLGLRDAEYAVMAQWLLDLSEFERTWPHSIGRAFDTVELLRQETRRLALTAQS